LIEVTAPSRPQICNSSDQAPNANILQASIERLQCLHVNPGMAILASSADRKLRILSVSELANFPNELVASNLDVNNCIQTESPILSYQVLLDRYIAYTTISGSLSLYDASKRKTVGQSRKDHTKYAVQVIQAPNKATLTPSIFLATAGWDSKILLYLVSKSTNPDEEQILDLQAPVASLTLESLPESMVFSTNPSDGSLYLICCRRDSTHLHYFRVETSNADAIQYTLLPAGKQNLAPHANSWNAFTPSSIAACPSEPTLLAVATSSTPYMKALVVRLRFPPLHVNQIPVRSNATVIDDPDEDVENEARAQARDVAAVLFHCNTMIGQTQYSMPVIAWRPDGTGIWFAGEEGVIKGIDRTGKIVAELRGHDASTKVRSLWSGWLELPDQGKKEILISGGFDQKLIVWHVSDETH
jgi:hypothetical protein